MTANTFKVLMTPSLNGIRMTSEWIPRATFAEFAVTSTERVWNGGIDPLEGLRLSHSTPGTDEKSTGFAVGLDNSMLAMVAPPPVPDHRDAGRRQSPCQLRRAIRDAQQNRNTLHTFTRRSGLDSNESIIEARSKALRVDHHAFLCNCARQQRPGRKWRRRAKPVRSARMRFRLDAHNHGIRALISNPEILLGRNLLRCQAEFHGALRHRNRTTPFRNN